MALNLMERVIFLRSTRLCGSLPDTALRAIAEVAEERSFRPGEPLCVEGEIGTDMFLLVDGQVEVRVLGTPPPAGTSGGDRGRLVATLGPGESLGEMSVLDDEPRSASVIARDRVTALTVHKEDLRDAIAVCPDLAFGLFRVLAGRLRDTLGRVT